MFFNPSDLISANNVLEFSVHFVTNQFKGRVRLVEVNSVISAS